MRSHRPALLLALSMLVLPLAGCASGGGTPRPEGASPDRIVQAELADLQNLDAYDAIQRLRAAWLRVRAGSDPPVVYLDGSRMGAVDRLRGIRTSEVVQMERINSSDATTRFGTGHMGGAILVSTR